MFKTFGVASAALFFALTARAETGGSTQRLVGATVVTPSNVVYVNNQAQWEAARNAATAGQTIRLNPGTYSRLDAENITKSGVIVEPTTGCGVTSTVSVPGILAYNGQGFTFRCFEVTPDYSYSNKAVLITAASQNITIDQNYIHGQSTPVANDDAIYIVGDSANITISNNSITKVTSPGVDVNDAHYVTIHHNDIYNIADDGIDVIQSTYVTVTQNRIRDFVITLLDHPDAIQFHTGGATGPSTNILIDSNLICRGTGTGPYPFQGIFVANEDHITYTNVTITNNMVIGAQYNGLGCAECDILTITGNTVQGFTDFAPSGLFYNTVTNATITGNSAGAFNAGGTNTGTFTPNTTLAAIAPTTACPPWS